MTITQKQSAAVAYQAIGSLRRQLQEVRDAASVRSCTASPAITSKIDEALASLDDAQKQTGHEPSEAQLEAAAISLASVLFAPGGRPEGTVGHDGWRLHIYIYARTWQRSPQFVSWEGIPVIWNIGVGRVRTFSALRQPL